MTIPLRLLEPDKKAAVEVDGNLVARLLDLDVATFRRLMDIEQISVLCERGTGEDSGKLRATFYHQGKRARLLLDPQGRVIEPVAEVVPASHRD